jgi:hypothetical protein
MNELVSVYLANGDIDGAIGLSRDALEIAESIALHCPQVVRAMDDLSAAYRAKREDELADRITKRARCINEASKR